VGQTQTFRSPTAVVVWVVWLLFAVGNWIDLAVQGRDHGSAVAAAILLLATGAVYVAAQRPRIIADEAGLTIRNPLRDHRIGWAGVTKIDLADLLRVHCGEHNKVVHAWAVPYSRRRRFAAEVRARRTSGARRSTFGSFGLPSSGGRGLAYGATASGTETSAAEAEAERIVRMLSEHATAVQAEAVWASGTAETGGTQDTTGTERTRTQAASPAALDASGWFEPLRSTWSGRAIAALVVPALILLIVWLA
jgi:hypothetical protein